MPQRTPPPIPASILPPDLLSPSSSSGGGNQSSSSMEELNNFRSSTLDHQSFTAHLQAVMTAQQNMAYVGHSGKAYMFIDKKQFNDSSSSGSSSSMIKCSIRLKEGKSLLVKKQSEHTLTFKITPFTCAKYTIVATTGSSTNNKGSPPQHAVHRVLVCVSDLSCSSNFGADKTTATIGNPSSTPSGSGPLSVMTKQPKQCYFVSDLQFIFGSEEEAKEWCDKIQNNVYCYCTELVTSKIQKDSAQALRTTSPSQETPKTNSLMEGYLIRKNQKPHIKTYQKPSVIYAELANKQLLFFSSHKKSKVADVIGCRVDFTRENYTVEKLSVGSQNETLYHKRSFQLNVYTELEPREIFACPCDGDMRKWLTSLSTNPVSPEIVSKLEHFTSDVEPQKDHDEKDSDEGGDDFGEEEMDEELAMLLGFGGDTVVVHEDMPTKDKDEVVGDGILETGEPDIFEKRKKNVFGGSFWKPLTPTNKHPSSSSVFSLSPPSNTSIEISPPPSDQPGLSPPKELTEVEYLRKRVAELEKLLESKTKECDGLRQELTRIYQ